MSKVRRTTVLLLATCSWALAASSERVTIALVGDFDVFNLGQSGYCGKRAPIDRPTDLSFEIPAGKKTWFFARASVRGEVGRYICEGDFSMTPEPGRMYIIRYTHGGRTCQMEVFVSQPGGKPEPAPFEFEPRRSCLGQ